MRAARLIFEEKTKKNQKKKKKKETPRGRQNARPAHAHKNALFMSARNKRANLCFCELFGFFFARARVYLVGKRDFFFSFRFFVSNSNF